MSKIKPHPPFSTIVAFSNQLQLSGLRPDDYSVAILANCYSRLGRVDFAFSLLGKHLKLGYPPDVVIINTLLNGLIASDMLPQAIRLLDKIVKLGIQPDLFTYGSMFKGLCRIGDNVRALSLLRDMECKAAFKPDAVIYNTLILKLSAYAIVNLSETVCLPCLKILHLKEVMVLGLTSVGKFLSGCPLLYDLCLESFSINVTDQLSFSASSLTRLSLTSISLIEAYLDIPRFEDFEDALDISHSAYDLIQGVSSVKRLFLSGHCMKALTYVKDELPILSRLTKLELGGSIILHDTLPRLLESAPYLEELIFTKGLFPAKFEEEDVFEQDYWGRHDDVPSCLKTKLKVVEIKYLLGFAEELKMVEYFLCNGSSLVRLTIHKLAGVAEPSQVTKQLHKMAKRWNKCVHFCDLLL